MSVAAPVYLIVGAPAVGKSTTARALAASHAKSIHIPVDTLREMVVSGLVLPGLEWGPSLVEQLAAARASACAMARAYHAAGFAVVIDDFWDHHSGLAEYAALRAEFDLHRVLLYPGQKTALARNQHRAGDSAQAGYIAAGISTVYAALEHTAVELHSQGWMLVDNTDLSPDETVARILTAYALRT